MQTFLWRSKYQGLIQHFILLCYFQKSNIWNSHKIHNPSNLQKHHIHCNALRGSGCDLRSVKDHHDFLLVAVWGLGLLRHGSLFLLLHFCKLHLKYSFWWLITEQIVGRLNYLDTFPSQKKEYPYGLYGMAWLCFLFINISYH